jgi:response regulator RpfG family c-di-GMP phosphodiesterase
MAAVEEPHPLNHSPASPDPARETVLFVDDEPNLLSSLRRQLGREFHVLTANGGAEALDLLECTPSVAVVVSDMRMPGMSGVDLMHAVRQRHPRVVRMMLSGQADLDSTIAAVNDGHIFRFVTKPATAELLRKNLHAALEQYRLVASRADLLERTLEGLVHTLNDMLGMSNPVARQRALRVSQYVTAMAHAMKFTMPWELRLAALLSQVGCAALPPNIFEKVYRSEPLSPVEQAQYQAHPRLAAAMISRIPQLGAVAEIIARQQDLDRDTLPADESTWDDRTRSVVILAAATLLDESMAAGDGPQEARQRLAALMPWLPPAVMAALEQIHCYSDGMAVHYVTRSALTPGMVVDEDVLSDTGELILSRGEEITRAHMETLRRTARESSSPARARAEAPLRVLIPA